MQVLPVVIIIATECVVLVNLEVITHLMLR